MKKLYTLLLLSFYFLSFGQKNNYNSFVSYEDEYLDKILYPQKFISSGSDYLFIGEIKSVYLEKLDGTGKITGAPSKTFFNKKQKVDKRIIYSNNLKDYNVIEFYYSSKYGGDPVVKASYEILNGETKHNTKSEIDTIKQLIINKRFINNQLNEIDSIFYTKDFKPLEIRTSSPKYIDKSIKKIAYLENGRIYKEVYKRNNSSFGSFMRYNEAGKILYSYQLKFEEFDNVPIDYDDENKSKGVEFKWKNDKDFDVYENNKLVSTFVFNDRKIHKEDNESSSTTYFDQHLLPIKIVSVDNRYNFNIEITFEYNKFNDLVTEKVKYDDAPMIIKSYKYLFDEKNNWIERKEYENGKLIFTTKRKIDYN